MTLYDLISDVAEEVGDDITDADIRARYVRYANEIQRDVGYFKPWNFMKRWGQMVIPDADTVDNIVKVDKDTYTVERGAGGNADFSSDHIGKYLRIATMGSNGWLKIAGVPNATTALFEIGAVANYSGEALGGTIWQRFYKLPSDVWALLPNPKSMSQRAELDYVPLSRFSADYPYFDTLAKVPLKYSNLTESDEDTIYNTSTGTVTAAADSDEVTIGVVTDFYKYVQSGNVFIVGDYEYEIKKRLSATKFQLYQKVLVAISTTGFSIRTPRNIQMEIYPSGYAAKLTFYFMRRLPQLIHDDDKLLFPALFQTVLHQGVRYKALRKNVDTEWKDEYNLYVQLKRDVANRYSRNVHKMTRFDPKIFKRQLSI